MPSATIQIPVDPGLAEVYNTATDQERQKLRALLTLWLRELERGERVSLGQTMDTLSDRAQARGLTPDILESLLKDGE